MLRGDWTGWRATDRPVASQQLHRQPPATALQHLGWPRIGLDFNLLICHQGTDLNLIGL